MIHLSLFGLVFQPSLFNFALVQTSRPPIRIHASDRHDATPVSATPRGSSSYGGLTLFEGQAGRFLLIAVCATATGQTEPGVLA